MALIKEQRILNQLQDNSNITCVRVITTSQNFNKRFDGSMNDFFQRLKNSLQSVGGITNRKIFKGISGVYFCMDDSIDFDIIILIDKSISNPSEFQWRIRLHKLLGDGITIEFGNFRAFADRLFEMGGIVRKFQAFGEYYKRSN
jgi:hypothetical protein